jgi:hypothetical protein
VRELSKPDLLEFLSAKIGRWDNIWWNGELIGLGEALGRASELPPSEHAICSHDEVLLPAELERSTKVAGQPPRRV